LGDDGSGVCFHRTGLEKMHQPAVGQLDLTYEGMELLADPGLTLFVLTAEPSSATADRLKLVASWAETEGTTAVAHESAGNK
jgi:hypothetical protein